MGSIPEKTIKMVGRVGIGGQITEWIPGAALHSGDGVVGPMWRIHIASFRM